MYWEHFTVSQQKVEIKPAEHITTSSVQSPDDLDATYRNKNGKDKRGQPINVVETANPENTLNLITDVSVQPVNKDDSKVLGERLEPIKKKTPSSKSCTLMVPMEAAIMTKSVRSTGSLLSRPQCGAQKPVLRLRLKRYPAHNTRLAAPSKQWFQCPHEKGIRLFLTVMCAKPAAFRTNAPPSKERRTGCFISPMSITCRSNIKRS